VTEVLKSIKQIKKMGLRREKKQAAGSVQEEEKETVGKSVRGEVRKDSSREVKKGGGGGGERCALKQSKINRRSKGQTKKKKLSRQRSDGKI